MFQLLSIAARLLALTTCLALTVIIAFQLRHDGKSRLFGLLTLNFALLAIFGLLSRVAKILNYPDQTVFTLWMIAAVFTGTVSILLFTFTTEYFDLWNAWRKWFGAVLFIVTVIATVAFVTNAGFVYFQMLDDGTVYYQLYPLIYILLAIGQVGALLTLGTVIREYIQRRNQGQTANILILWGLTILCAGFLTVSITPLNKYAPQIPIFTIGSVLIAGPVLRQRLFDPLLQAHEELKHRSEQLKVITVVGQQATSLLELDTDALLNIIVEEIQKTFSYHTVAILLPDISDMVVRAVAGNSSDMLVANFRLPIDENSTIGAATEKRQLVSSSQIQKKKPDVNGELRSATRSELSIPLLVRSKVASEEVFIGILDIQSEEAEAFHTEDLEVLQILARHLAIAIRNAQLFHAKERAEAADRAKSQFLANMSHELRLPLHMIGSSAEILLLGIGGDHLQGIQLKAAQTIHSSGERLLKLVEDVLDLSKIETGQIDIRPIEIDLKQFIEEIIDNMQNLAEEKGLSLTLVTSGLPQVVNFDADKLQTILTNLVANAIKFTLKGRVDVRVDVLNTLPHQTLQLEVSDTGIGIPFAYLDKIFDNFYQVESSDKRTYQGAGIGLALVKKLVDALGGQITVDSAVNEGSKFTVDLPLKMDIKTSISITSPA